MKKRYQVLENLVAEIARRWNLSLSYVERDEIDDEPLIRQRLRDRLLSANIQFAIQALANGLHILAIPVRDARDRVIGVAYADGLIIADTETDEGREGLRQLAESGNFSLEMLHTLPVADYNVIPELASMIQSVVEGIVAMRLPIEEQYQSDPEDASLDQVLQHFGQIVSRDQVMHENFAIMRKFSDSLVPVLIEGPAGAGKGRFVREIAEASSWSRIVEFDARRQGRLSELLDRLSVSDVTLSIKNLENLSDEHQRTLVKVIGEQRESMKGPRLVFSSGRQLNSYLERGRIRSDFYYRISTVHIRIPALADRPDDILPLISRFVQELAPEGRSLENFDRRTLQALLDYHWPGNVDELRREMLRLFHIYGDQKRYTPEMFPAKIVGATSKYLHRVLKKERKLHAASVALERMMIADSLQRAGGNKSHTSRELGISRSGLIQKIEKYGLDEAHVR
jgi:DNA-binding NtrC family response regulator